MGGKWYPLHNLEKWRYCQCLSKYHIPICRHFAKSRLIGPMKMCILDVTANMLISPFKFIYSTNSQPNHLWSMVSALFIFAQVDAAPSMFSNLTECSGRALFIINSNLKTVRLLKSMSNYQYFNQRFSYNSKRNASNWLTITSTCSWL